MKVRFSCPGCETSLLIDAPSPDWQCACGRTQRLSPPEPAADRIDHCVACGCSQVYRQKNFPQWLGLSFLAVACSAFFVLQLLYLKETAWAVLLGSAAIDLVLYLIVGDVIVCYRCQARHYGLARQKSYDLFELSIAEKYRQERIRRELAGKS